jgi:uncharacterized membrane-anchored protein
MKHLIAAATLAGALWAGASLAQSGDDGQAKQRALLASLHYQDGTIALDKANAHITVKPGFHFLGHDDSRRVLEEYWGNPPDDSVLGMLVPDDAGFDSEHSWAVVLTYSDEDGHVSDEDAAKIDYNQLLKDMQTGIHDDNAERKKAGYDGIELVGWAQAPRYDAAGKRLYWAKELAFEGHPVHTLNYDIRVLNREGYLSMNAVADVTDKDRVLAGMEQVLPMAEFDSGHRYADFKPGSDKLAAYGLAALIGGGIAAKTGLLAKLGLMLLALKKFVVVAFLAVAAFVKKLFGKKGGGGTVQ